MVQTDRRTGPCTEIELGEVRGVDSGSYTAIPKSTVRVFGRSYLRKGTPLRRHMTVSVTEASGAVEPIRGRNCLLAKWLVRSVGDWSATHPDSFNLSRKIWEAGSLRHPPSVRRSIWKTSKSEERFKEKDGRRSEAISGVDALSNVARLASLTAPHARRSQRRRATATSKIFSFSLIVSRLWSLSVKTDSARCLENGRMQRGS